MHRLPVIFIVLSMTLSARGQDSLEQALDLSHLIKNQPAHWWDVSFGISELVPDYFARGEMDSLLLIMRYWEEQTDYYEPLRRLWMLLQIHQNSFDPGFISQAVVEDMYDYQYRIKNQKDSTDWYLWGGDTSSAMISRKFNSFTKQLATDLLQFDDLSDDEWLVCLFFSHNFDAFWQAFENGEAAQTLLYKRFYKEFKETTRLSLHYELFSGWYSPRKDLVALGSKVLAGGSVGFEFDRILIDGTLAFRALNPAEPYRVGYMDEIIETSHYLGVYIGVEPSFVLYNFGRLRIDLLSGLALGFIEAIPMEENPFEEESVDMLAANSNLGVGARFFLLREKPYFIRFQMRYEFAGYNSHGGTELSEGEALTLRLGFGWDENSRKYKMQKYFPNN